MSKIEIRNRFTGSVIWSGEAESLGDAAVKAIASGANLARASLARASLDGANLVGAKGAPELASAAPESEEQRNTHRARSRAERAARYRARNPDVPVVPMLDTTILGLVDAKQGGFDMRSWHGEHRSGDACGTTHCRAGWAVNLAGKAGYELEKKYGPAVAGGMIYRASAGHVPYFYGSTELALEDMRSCAELERIAATEQEKS